MTTLVVFIAVMRMSVATDRLFFKDETGAEQTTVRAAVGENIFLECEAGGSKSPTIHWLHHGRRVQQVNLRWRVTTVWHSVRPSYTLVDFTTRRPIRVTSPTQGIETFCTRCHTAAHWNFYCNFLCLCMVGVKCFYNWPFRPSANSFVRYHI